MRGWTRVAVALLFLGGLPGLARAQSTVQPGRTSNTNVGTSAAEFLSLGAGARGMALGNGFAAIVRDVEGLYYNPAALPMMDGPQALLTIMPYFADTDYFWGGFAFPFAGGEYGIGISIANFGFSDQPIYTEADPDGLSGETYGVSETMLALSFAHAFIDRFSGGLTAKFISDKLGQTRATGFALDVGTNFHTEMGGRPIAFSFVIQNIGTTLRYDGQGLNVTTLPPGEENTPVAGIDPFPARFQSSPFQLPIAFRVGLGYDVVSNANGRLSVLGEFTEANNQDPTWGFGSEYQWESPDGRITVAGRGSYSFQPDNYLSNLEQQEFAGSTPATDRGLDGLSLGGGIRYQFAEYEGRVDYTYRHFGTLGNVNVFTIGFAWR